MPIRPHCVILVFCCLLAFSLSQYSYYGGPSITRCGGRCVAIQQCTPLLSLLKERPLQPATVATLRQAHCGFEGNNPKVCCPGSPPVRTPPPVQDLKPQPMTSPSGWESHPNARMIPADNCGIDFSQRIWGGNETDIEQYPWTALFQYQLPTGTKRFGCGGVLITKRYVVTAAHCLARGDLRRLSL